MINLVRTIILLIAAAVLMNSSFAGSSLERLWCMFELGGGTAERRVEDGNFSVNLDSSWDRSPNVDDLMHGLDREGQMVKHKVYRFMGMGKTQWLAVEYKVLAHDATPSRDIATWVDGPMSFYGRVQLLAPDEITYRQKSIARVQEADDDFMRKHHIDKMSLHVGLITIDGKWHRFFIVCLNRGRENWQIVKVFPAHSQDGASDSEADMVKRTDVMKAWRFIRNFKVLGETSLSGEDLIWAVKAGDQIKVGELLSKGVDPNYKGRRNVTPLGAFVSRSDMDEKLPILKQLLEKGADPNVVCFYDHIQCRRKRSSLDCGTTPFYCLFNHGLSVKFLPVVRLMLEHGADPNRKQGRLGLTPFEHVVMRARSPDMDLVQTIAEHGGIVTQKMVVMVKDEKVKAYLRNRLKLITDQSK